MIEKCKNIYNQHFPNLERKLTNTIQAEIKGRQYNWIAGQIIQITEDKVIH